ncbi:unnamed protein product [Chrysodeixis includens]|uniref:Uncharacterized protein n=1 Tax=Chrysodeixis includens TaxID=689277 RepID=A0A9N8PZ87_CHRIL|nr:unnamed protein product [Chrysodeixis includens]
MPLQRHNAWKSVINMTRNDDDYHYQHERGHSHLYHGHNPPQMYSYPITNEINYNSNQDFRRYDYTTQTVSLVSNSNYRKFYQQAQCTRRWPQIESNGCCGSNQCTKGPDACCQQTTCPTPCPEQFTNPVLDLCSCTIQTCRTTCPSTCTTSCCNVPCQYSSPTCPTTTNCCTSSCEMHCNDCRKSGLIQNYDMFPNVVVRSGNKRVQEFSTKKEPSLFRSLKMNHSHQRIHEGSDEVLRDETDVSKFNLQDHDYMYRSFDTRLRKRRQLDDQITLVPFWQLKKSNNRNPSQLKSMRYTTLTNKNNRNTRRNTALAKWLSSTEPITLNIADYEDDNEHVTEKFLSFNELMHLRKINDGYAGYDFRRDDSKKTTKKKESTKNDKTTKDKTTNEKTTKTTKAKTNKTTKETTTKTTKSKTNKTQKETKATKVTVPVTEQAIEVDDNSATEMVREEEQHTHYSYETTLNPYANLTHFPYPPYYNSSYYTTEQYYTYTTVDPYYSYTYHAYETTAYYTHEETHIATVTFTLTSSFERLKYCTRKLTCTWTSYTANSRGDGDNGNDWSKEIGSRTPPGYVEGCTRTSTCTRINMDRNKVFTVSRDGDDMTNPGGDGTGDDGSATGVGDDDDGDYCERRSLNVQRRNSDNKESLPHKLNDQDLNLTIKSCKIENELNITSETRGVTINVSDVHDCVCVKNYSRKKRQENYNPKMLMLPADMLCRDSKKSFSYGELYYMILNRVFGSKRENQFHRNECACNGSNTSGTIALLFLLEYFISMFNVYIYGIL